MFKKLRNKFLRLNMVMISVLLIASFCVVYMVTFNNISRTIDSQLNRSLSTFQNRNQKDKDSFSNHNGFKKPGGIFGGKNNSDTQDIPSYIPDNPEIPSNLPDDFPGALYPPPPEPTDSFAPAAAPNEPVSLLVQSDGTVIEKRSPYNYEDSLYTQVIDDAISKLSEDVSNNSSIAKSDNVIKHDDIYWKYMIKVITPEDSNSSGPLYAISMLNITAQFGFLQKLIIILIFVLIFALIIVFLICLYFANKSIKPIELAWDKQSQFIADASHELKTPLTTINTNIDVLLAHSDNTINDEKKWLMYIQDEVTRMAKLTDNLLFLTKVDYSNTENTIFANFSLSSAVENVLLTLEAVIYEKNINLVCDIRDNINIIGDKDRMKQLILILLDNAIKYTNQNGTIEVNLARREKHAELSVKNTGDGILPEDIDRVFDRFYRFDKSRARNSGGYGLGLAIAKSIVTLHKGTINVKSAPREYTKFTVTIPLA